ncbi:HAD family hydrolase [Ectobacillus funiculus]|uniref:HAD family hydrolase n=1 Tax=Ectobacillus funiculus TaxID=137993 RepID=UPI00101D67F7|nr:HAD family hydrolase [Ectobacillus funiculus]
MELNDFVEHTTACMMELLAKKAVVQEMGIKGVLFDKDGTLLNFGMLWVAIEYEVIDALLEKVGEARNSGLKEALCTSIGLHNGQVDEKGYFASGTSLDISRAFQAVLPYDIPDLHGWLMEQATLKTKEHIQNVQPTCDLQTLFSQMKEKGLTIGIATSDDDEITRLCVEALHIEEYISFVGTAELYPKKPDPAVVYAFCRQFGLQPHEVAIVGDTEKDLQLAKNSGAGCGISVLCGVGSEEELSALADFVVLSPAHLIQDGVLIWDRQSG